MNQIKMNKILELMNKIDYTFIESFYINGVIHVKYICDKGHDGSSRLDHFKNGHKCKTCGYTSSREKQILKIEYVKNQFKENNCELLETTYISAKTKMKYICVCGNESEICWDKFRVGQRCKECKKRTLSIKNSGPNHAMWNPDREIVELRKIIHKKCKSLIRYTLQRIGQRKISKSEELLGYTKQELLEHFQKDLLFDEFIKCKETIHIDHIFPVKAFIEYGITDIKLINALDNLQLLHKKDNLQKSGYYNKDNFKKYLVSKNIIFVENTSLSLV